MVSKLCGAILVPHCGWYSSMDDWVIVLELKWQVQLNSSLLKPKVVLWKYSLLPKSVVAGSMRSWREDFEAVVFLPSSSALVAIDWNVPPCILVSTDYLCSIDDCLKGDSRQAGFHKFVSHMRITLSGGWLATIWGVLWAPNGAAFVTICSCQVSGAVHFTFPMDEEVTFVYEANCCY